MAVVGQVVNLRPLANRPGFSPEPLGNRDTRTPACSVGTSIGNTPTRSLNGIAVFSPLELRQQPGQRPLALLPYHRDAFAHQREGILRLRVAPRDIA
jgi:hypothetical protein